MTNKNSPWNEGARTPFLFKPAGKDSLWGSSRSREKLHRALSCQNATALAAATLRESTP